MYVRVCSSIHSALETFSQNTRRALIILVTVAVLIRLVALIAIPTPHLSTNAVIAYLGGAQRLVSGEGFLDPTYPLFTPPLYAVIIAGLLSVFGEDQIATKILQIILDAATVAIVFVIGLQIFNARVATISASVWAVYPFAIYATLYIGTETIFTFFLGLFLLLLYFGISSQQWHYFVGSGIVLGLATMTRGATQFLPFGLPLLGFLYQRNLKKWLAHCAMLGAAFVVVLLPWCIRNYVVIKEVVPVAMGGGVFLWGASEQLLTIEERDKELPEFLRKLEADGLARPSGHVEAAEADRYMIRAAMKNYYNMLTQDPFKLIGFFLIKFVRLWYATESGRNYLIVLGLNLPLYTLAICGVALAKGQRNVAALLPFWVIVYFIALHWATFPLFRYMLPIMPFLGIYFAVALSHVLERSCKVPGPGKSEPLIHLGPGSGLQ